MWNRMKFIAEDQEAASLSATGKLRGSCNSQPMARDGFSTPRAESPVSGPAGINWLLLRQVMSALEILTQLQNWLSTATPEGMSQQASFGTAIQTRPGGYYR